MKTQIFATFGPACGTEQILKEMILAGVTGMRLNLSHTTLSESKAYINAYTNAARTLNKTPQILIDMQGPELRIGAVEETIFLRESQLVYLLEDDAQRPIDTILFEGADKIMVPSAVIDAVQKKDILLLDDGKIVLEVTQTSDRSIKTPIVQARVVIGGILKGHKSIKIKNRNIDMPVLTAHDIENIKLAKQYGVTALMQPFVLSGEDLTYVRNILKENQAEDLQIYAKIENHIGLENLESIIPMADVIVIARGDLGNDMPLWELPKAQKQIEEYCKHYQKPYIVVTQMLASMEQNPIPTRAEVSDIFHAVYHGAWGVMLTGETAVGKYPVEAIEYMVNTAKEAENL